LPAKLIQVAQSNIETVLAMLNTSSEGLSDLQSDLRLNKIGLNEIAHEKPPKWYVQFLKTFQNPLVILLMKVRRDF
jgi:Mg2+-importing ATPase